MNNYILKDELTELIRGHEFASLFFQLGWDAPGVSSESFMLQLRSGAKLRTERVAEKRGLMVCVCDAGVDYPSTKAERRHLVTQLARRHYEHLLIILGEGKQCWMSSIRPQNRPLRTVEVVWYENQDIQSLMEKLHGLIFEISDEGNITLTDVVSQVRDAFMQNAEKVTKKFYKKFSEQLTTFSDFIQGIQEQVSKDWYAALMLNRLMFIYFIQKKGFLDGDSNYLENRLKQTQQQFGQDQFDKQFYRHFLRRLFAEGLGQSQGERGPELNKLLGRVPYLNGGLFDLHEVELANENIEIPDSAFEKLFAFFDGYNWHLDSRPTAHGNDINPDVIGYIFEKYINDRAKMGAYYTQEDVTGYIARNTIIPFLLNRAKEKCKNAFDGQNGIWRLLRENPDHYIYDAVKKGCDIPDAEIPQNIRQGMDPRKPNLLPRRKDWNTPTDEKFALPTEIWRETLARRARYFELKQKMEKGEVREIDDLITYNLDIERFAADVLRNYEDSDFINAFYSAIAGKQGLKSNEQSKRGITVLDPACGSGAFLFAALNILEPLYERCVERMEYFVEEDDAARVQGKRQGAPKYPQFRAVLADIKDHQNEKYWIYKTIILNNLYGVDLMKEAVEIAKLRLFLKLAAEAEYDSTKADFGLAPLPDIDFNIRSGNSLVGFVSIAQLGNALTPDTGQQSMDTSGGLLDEIREDAKMVEMTGRRFKESQDDDAADYRDAKDELSGRLGELNEKMNRYLAYQYGKNENEADYEKWLNSHRPFHWLAEFYGIVVEDGGFDVVIGNPPYVEYSKVKKDYMIRDYETEECGNLYAYFIERGLNLAGKNKDIGMIVPISLVGTPRTQTVRDFLESQCRSIHISNYADRPGALFNGVHQKVSILQTSHNGKKGTFSTNFLHWYSRSERNDLFAKIYYVKLKTRSRKIYPKIGCAIENSISKKIRATDQKLISVMSAKESKGSHVYLNMRLMYWVKCFLIPQKSREFKKFYATADFSEKEIMAILNSTIFFWFWETESDCWHLTNRELNDFSVSGQNLTSDEKFALATLSEYLAADLEKNKGFVGTVQTDYEYYHKKSKKIIDKIDVILAAHYNFTEEELDYIINYDIKYRMGLSK